MNTITRGCNHHIWTQTTLGWQRNKSCMLGFFTMQYPRNTQGKGFFSKMHHNTTFQQEQANEYSDYKAECLADKDNAVF